MRRRAANLLGYIASGVYADLLATGAYYTVPGPHLLRLGAWLTTLIGSSFTTGWIGPAGGRV